LVCNAADDEFFMPDNIRWWWDQMPMYQELNRFITLPTSDHTTVPGTLELLGSINTWLRELLTASRRLGPRPAPRSLADRTAASLQLLAAADLPHYNWTISPSGEEITVQADRQPIKVAAGSLVQCYLVQVTMWHSSTCHAHANTRKDFRLINDDDPCECGIHVPVMVTALYCTVVVVAVGRGGYFTGGQGGHCLNLAIVWVPWELQESAPGGWRDRGAGEMCGQVR
jgi:hypothetical protein